jgi:hypothetical protein
VSPVFDLVSQLFFYMIVVYYESIKRELKIRCINECRCDERLQTKTKEITRLADTLVTTPKGDSSKFLFFSSFRNAVEQENWDSNGSVCRAHVYGIFV